MAQIKDKIFLWFQKIITWVPSLESLRPRFHWKYSSVYMPFTWGLGPMWWQIDEFILAYLCFFIAWVWSIGGWITSDIVFKKIQQDGNVKEERGQRHGIKKFTG